MYVIVLLNMNNTFFIVLTTNVCWLFFS